jgi:hypothetical protein
VRLSSQLILKAGVIFVAGDPDAWAPGLDNETSAYLKPREDGCDSESM